LASMTQLSGGPFEPLGKLARSKVGDPFVRRWKSLTGLLQNSTIGVALFDGDLQCKALNGALGAMIAASPDKHIGKQLQQLFPGAPIKLEVAFRRVWATGSSLSNLELTVPLRIGSEPRRWLVNFYPISDELGQVRFVAASFSEITREHCVELKITRLRDKFHSNVRREPNLLKEEFSETSTRTFEVVSRSVALLRNSVLLRFYASEKRLEAGLIRHALYLRGSGEEKSPSFPIPNVTAQANPSIDQEPRDVPDPGAGAPSPREREVLHFLADGKSNKEIGVLLEISTRTVESYRARIMLKLDLHSTAALVRYAIRNKIVEA
jgi:DNA-binding CsgD family transcriptional regulator